MCSESFRLLFIAYDVGGCHMSVVIDLGEVDCVCGCVMYVMVFLWCIFEIIIMI